MIRVCLPWSYAHAPQRHYPVLYVQDGQNVFSRADSGACYGWGGWELDRVVARLTAGGHMREVLVVAVDHSHDRWLEYGGPGGPRGAQGQTRFDQYSRFLREDLKPHIDAQFRTQREPAQTGLLGASLGGLCSLAVAWEHPRTFGLVACLSGSFQLQKRYFAEEILGQYRGPRKPIKIYLDSGFLDFGDDDGQQHTAWVAACLRRCGWRNGLHLEHRVDRRLLTDRELAPMPVPPHKWREARQSQHNELYWRLRVRHALEFLFPPD